MRMPEEEFNLIQGQIKEVFTGVIIAKNTTTADHQNWSISRKVHLITYSFIMKGCEKAGFGSDIHEWIFLKKRLGSFPVNRLIDA